MILSLSQLVSHLNQIAPKDDTKPQDALWIRFTQEQTQRTMEYRTPDDNQILHVYLNKDGALVGIEIFP